MVPVNATKPNRAPLGRVGVRELRQNLSVHLARVVAGETLQVTDRGRAVALLTPLPAASTLVQRLVASGRATPATVRLAQVPPAPRIPPGLGPRLQRVLRESREETR